MYKVLGICLLAVVLCGLPSLTQDDRDVIEERRCNNLTTCGDCISGSTADDEVSLNCYWCGAFSANRCRRFDAKVAIPISGIDCPELKYNVGTCKLTALVIIILIFVGVFLFVVLFVTVCCICCCWCSRRKKRVRMLEDAHYAEEKDSIRQRSAERRAERKAKHDEIRRKYGLNHEDDPAGSYKRL